MAVNAPDARIAHELSGCPTPRPVGPRPGPEWCTLIEAYQLMGYDGGRYGLSLSVFAGLPRVKCATNLPGRKPWLLRRRDVERMVALRREAKLSLRAAASVVRAEIEGRL